MYSMSFYPVNKKNNTITDYEIKEELKIMELVGMFDLKK